MKRLTYLIIFSSILLMSVFVGCEQDDLIEQESINKCNEKWTYLSLPPEADFDNLTKEEYEVICQAFFRLDIKESEDGLLEIIPNSGKELNISNELYDYFQLILEDANENKLSEICFRRNNIKTRASESETQKAPTDCVARSIAYATGQNYEEISNWINERYKNNGVPSDKFYEVMRHFNPNGVQIGLSMFSEMRIMDPTGSKYIIVLNLGHAVNVIAKTGENIYYRDPQTGKETVCVIYNVSHVYELR